MVQLALLAARGEGRAGEMTGVRCPVCTADTTHVLGRKRDYTLHECRACDVLFAGSARGAAELDELYHQQYYAYADFVVAPTVRASLERLVRGAAPFRQTGRWLDIGYGEGGLLTVAGELGWECYGSEISPRVLEYGRRRGWIVSPDPAADPRFPRGGFDVVTMIELLEHLTAPSRMLAIAAASLRPGGLLYLTTPNVRSLNRRVLGLRWSTVAPPEHLVLWSVRAVRRVLAHAGFEVQGIRTEGLNPAEMVARFAPARAGVAPVDRNRSAVALSAALSRGPLRRALKRAANGMLSAVGVGDTLKVWAVRS